MYESKRTRFLELSNDAQTALIAAARDVGPVHGLTHGFYKYPARFSPIFAGAVIRIFTEPGDLVLDPHVGGGTTIVEALAAGRRAVGVDISTLAEFVSAVKCRVFTEAELDKLDWWAGRVAASVDVHQPSVGSMAHEELGYYKHLNHPSRWRLRKAIDQSLASTIKLGTPRLESFGRCVVLRTAQWVLDGRSKRTTVEEFRCILQEVAAEMVAGARELRAAVKANGRCAVTLLRRSAAGIEEEPTLQAMRAPRLVVTSPPYPGVHVLYHRWQVDGRKEAPLPFMIANKLDGAGSSYYTMGDRKYPELKTYFANIKASMSSVAMLADADTAVVQMVAFSEPKWQLPRYLQAMQEAGLTETLLPQLKGQGDGRLWRSVPGRRWYSAQRGTTPGSEEVVLFHRKANVSPSQLRDRQPPRLRTNLPARASSATA
jgi:DNA methylase